MVFKRFMRALGIGGPTVETVLDSTEVTPGGVLTGRVEITGGDHDTEIEKISLFLEAEVEHEYEYEYEDSEGEEVSGEGEYTSTARWGTLQVCDAFSLPAETKRTFEFELPIPFEAPVTVVGDTPLGGPKIGVRTRLHVDGALDKGDLDAITVRALPVQEKILAAFADLGFSFAKMDLEPGKLIGTEQRLPFHQEIEFGASPHYGDTVGDVELSFVADDEGTFVVLQIGALDDAGHTFRVSHADADEDVDWAELLAARFAAALDR
ncbi:sporulation protein [Thermobifida halotolerans]|uniref:Sporulation protein n=1 Tax=Thermobifida halotolerans TaxID=483545 RepID=A0A399FU27_9ACTN|nr:sporulation protein [Thermobifida halotolerans]UOE19081.1 sporulation protein [Thermobifida halotolerans]